MLWIIWLTGGMFLANNTSAQELVKNLWDKSCSFKITETQNEIKETLNEYKAYEKERNELFKDIKKNEEIFKQLIDSSIKKIDEEKAKKQDIQKLLYYMYCDCEFADIDAPKKLRDLLYKSKPRIKDNQNS